VIDGTIVGVDERNDYSENGSSRRRMPMIEYTDGEGSRKTFTASAASFNSQLGRKVWVAYQVKSGKARLLSLAEIFLWPSLLFCTGLVAFLLVVPISWSSEITYSALKAMGLLAGG